MQCVCASGCMRTTLNHHPFRHASLLDDIRVNIAFFEWPYLGTRWEELELNDETFEIALMTDDKLLISGLSIVHTKIHTHKRKHIVKDKDVNSWKQTAENCTVRLCGRTLPRKGLACSEAPL